MFVFRLLQTIKRLYEATLYNFPNPKHEKLSTCSVERLNLVFKAIHVMVIQYLYFFEDYLLKKNEAELQFVIFVDSLKSPSPSLGK